MHESLQMYTFLERKFRERYNGDIDFLPKIAIFLSKQATKKKKKKKGEILKIA